MSDEPYDAGNEQHVKASQGKRRRRKHYDAAAWNEVLSTYEGRYVINAILEMARPFAASFSLENARLTDFREGERNVGNKLIAHAFKGRQSSFSLMREEHAKRTNGEV